MTRAARVALALGALGIAFRLALVLTGAPPTNSDEATIGLMAVHIAERGAHPVFFYGQHYMGAVEAYLAAPLFAVLTPSVALLRLVTLALYAAFLAAMYLLTRRLYAPWYAVAVVGLLALGSDRVLKDELIAGGGYPEINALAAGLLLGAVRFAVRAPRRWWPYALWGLGAGLALWADFLVAPYVAAAGALLLAYRGGELWGRAGAALAGGALLGLAPLVAHDLTSPLRENSIAVLLHLNMAGEAAGFTAADQVYGGVLLGIPLGTGLCPPGRCGVGHLFWGAAYVPLLLAATAMAVLALRAARRTAPLAAGTAPAEPAAQVRQAGRLALAGAALVTILLYLRSPAAALTPIESARYLSCLLLSTPAALWPLWTLMVGLRSPGGRRAGARRAAGLAAGATLAAVLLASVAATVAAAGTVGGIRANDRDHRDVVTYLTERDVTRVYGEYWTCNRLTFATRERIVCAVLADDLSPGFDRHPPYRAAVLAAPDPGYVVLAGSPLDDNLRARLAGRSVLVRTFGSYRVYLPAVPLL
ncbi:hypothetical protein [Rhizomonospora bruguierae]|uniref:hypothetical protein n=1 Tax=Rhizomonospora bruguierae TaxID=1581705 RepID=UPI001BCCF896|nr:hypothetical protein [Micromonospora sp. NBRC 107566]